MKASLTIELDLSAPISVVGTTNDRLLIVIGGPDEPQKLAIVLPELTASLLAAKISACRLKQLSEEVRDFVTLGGAAKEAMSSLAAALEKRAAAEGATAAGNVVDLSSRRQP